MKVTYRHWFSIRFVFNYCRKIGGSIKSIGSCRLCVCWCVLDEECTANYLERLWVKYHSARHVQNYMKIGLFSLGYISLNFYLLDKYNFLWIVHTVSFNCCVRFERNHWNCASSEHVLRNPRRSFEIWVLTAVVLKSSIIWEELYKAACLSLASLIRRSWRWRRHVLLKR
jgi:hypothetical protein